jgi:hypothetical protein
MDTAAPPISCRDPVNGQLLMYWLAEPDEDFDGDEFRQWPFMSPTPPRAQ